MSGRLLAGILGIALLAPPAFGDDVHKPALDPAAQKEALRALDSSLQWLKSRQAADGSWSLKQYPAITALATTAILQDPSRKEGQADLAANKGLEYIASCARADGGIYCEVPRERGGSQSTYNTSGALFALGASHESLYDPLILAARRFLARSQHVEKDDNLGGWGYDANRKSPHADMINTGFVIRAFHLTQRVADLHQRESRPAESAQPAEPPKTPEGMSGDPDWAAAAAFLSHCQNLDSAENKGRAVSARPQDAGGFIYQPNGSMAGGEKDAEGRQVWHSYGNATSFGLACLLESHVDRSDPRVAATVDWLRSNFSVEEHAGGLGKQGVYFYYHTLALALSMYGEEPLQRAGKPPVEWRRELAAKLVSLQRTDPQSGLGYWVNDEGRWMENDPVLVTSYCALALEELLKEPAKPPSQRQ